MKLLKNKTGFLTQKAFYIELATYEDDFFGAKELYIKKDYTPISKRFQALKTKKEHQWLLAKQEMSTSTSTEQTTTPTEKSSPSAPSTTSTTSRAASTGPPTT